MTRHPRRAAPRRRPRPGARSRARPRAAVGILAILWLGTATAGICAPRAAPAADSGPAAPAPVPAPVPANATALPADPVRRCTALAGTVLAGRQAIVASAAVVPATGNAPELCLLTATFPGTALKLEARLPLSGWNHRLAFVGGGGFDGFLGGPQPFNSDSVETDRYAVLMTNGGHDDPADAPDYFQARFALDPVKFADFTFLSEHRALAPGRALIAAFYGAAPQRSFYEGCSMGGHDAMLLSQRFPDDFDGIVARAPAGNIMGLFTEFSRIAQAVARPGGNLPPAKRRLLADAVLARCDALDGLSDGIVSRPEACRFRPEELRCASGADEGDRCLSDAQLATVRAVTTPLSVLHGLVTHPGYDVGGENDPDGWNEYIWPPADGSGLSLQRRFSDGFIRSFITRNQSYDTLRWNPDEWFGRMLAVNAAYEAVDPDLSRFSRHGGKLIMLSGTIDTSVSPRDIARYDEAVSAKLGPATAARTLEFFRAPGMGHCIGGPGPDHVDLLRALATWVDTGTPPSAQHLVLTKPEVPAAQQLSRPLCRYPSYARYDGTGDPRSAGSFTCTAN
ncbi:MAG: tannase/feruloyl esterase family alpha/beta hydrolase [Gluconacetobacter diazotrophicus]|nr:tannase/feruloyl esterase family alpha/beta hydrolase [Gluconacetobacter diazotrophicus]